MRTSIITILLISFAILRVNSIRLFPFDNIINPINEAQVQAFLDDDLIANQQFQIAAAYDLTGNLVASAGLSLLRGEFKNINKVFDINPWKRGNDNYDITVNGKAYTVPSTDGTTSAKDKDGNRIFIGKAKKVIIIAYSTSDVADVGQTLFALKVDYAKAQGI